MSIHDFIDRVAKKHNHVPEQRCPECDDKITCHAGVTTEDKPDPGDVSICAVCGAILQFGPDLKVVVCPASELDEMKAEQPDNYETLMNLQADVRKFAQHRRRMNFGGN
jgi:hypothetical protein